MLVCLFFHSWLHSFCFSNVCSSKLYLNNSLLLIIPEQTIKLLISSAWDFSLYSHFLLGRKNIGIFSSYYLTLALSFFHINILSSLPFIPCILGELLIFFLQATDLIFYSVKISLPFLHCRLFFTLIFQLFHYLLVSSVSFLMTLFYSYMRENFLQFI